VGALLRRLLGRQGREARGHGLAGGAVPPLGQVRQPALVQRRLPRAQVVDLRPDGAHEQVRVLRARGGGGCRVPGAGGVGGAVARGDWAPARAAAGPGRAAGGAGVAGPRPPPASGARRTWRSGAKALSWWYLASERPVEKTRRPEGAQERFQRALNSLSAVCSGSSCATCGRRGGGGPRRDGVGPSLGIRGGGHVGGIPAEVAPRRESLLRKHAPWCGPGRRPPRHRSGGRRSACGSSRGAVRGFRGVTVTREWCRPGIGEGARAGRSARRGRRQRTVSPPQRARPRPRWPHGGNRCSERAKDFCRRIEGIAQGAGLEVRGCVGGPAPWCGRGRTPPRPRSGGRRSACGSSRGAVRGFRGVTRPARARTWMSARRARTGAGTTGSAGTREWCRPGSSTSLSGRPPGSPRGYSPPSPDSPPPFPAKSPLPPQVARSRPFYFLR